MCNCRGYCQDLGPDKLYSTLRSMTHQSSICAFWLWPGGKLSDHQAVGLRSSQRFRGRNQTEKEGDSSYINKTIRSGSLDWPSIIIEAGYSESTRQLRRDARWWIEH